MKRLMLTVFTLVMLAFGGMLLVSQRSTQVGAAGNDPNDIIKGGVSSITDLRAKYKANQGNVQSAFSRMDITSDMVNSATYKSGTIYKSGDIMVAGELVAMDAQTLGRLSMPGSTKVTPNGHTFYMRPTSTSLVHDSAPAIVFFDANGKFIGAVLNDCGNPVKAADVTVRTPAPAPSTEPKTYTCSALAVAPVGRTDFTFQAVPAVGTAEVKSITYTVKKDGNVIKTIVAKDTEPAKYTQTTPGDYTVEATVTAVRNGVTYITKVGGCTGKFTVEALPASYACTGLRITGPVNRTQFTFTPQTNERNGATFRSVVYTVRDSSNAVVFTSPTVYNKNAYTYTQTKPGNYTVGAATTFMVGNREYTTTDTNCAGTFTVSAPATVAQKCESLSAVRTGDRTQFTFTPTISPANATVKTIVYTVKDANGTVVGEPITRSNASPVSYTQTTTGKYAVTAVVTIVVDGRDVVATGDCSASFEVTAAPATPTYKCEQLKATPLSEKGVVQFALYAPADGGAKLSGASINYDHPNGDIVAINPDKLTDFRHTYPKNGAYTAQATVTFNVPEGAGTVPKTVTCSARVTVSNYPEVVTAAAPVPGKGSAATPTQLVNTGVADIIGIFAAVAAGGALSYRLIWARWARGLGR